jgi:hypothetical protein
MKRERHGRNWLDSCEGPVAKDNAQPRWLDGRGFQREG